MKRQEFLKICKKVVADDFNLHRKSMGNANVTAEDVEVVMYQEESREYFLKTNIATLLIKNHDNMCYSIMMFDQDENVYKIAYEKWQDLCLRELKRIFANAELIEKWKISHMRCNGEKIMFLGCHIEKKKKYAIYTCENRCYATESKNNMWEGTI